MSLNVEYKDRIIELYNEGHSYREIACILNKEFNTNEFYYEAIRGTVRRYKKHIAYEKADMMLEKANSNSNRNIEFGVVPNKKKKKILVLNDLHIPYQIDGVFDIIKKYKNEIDAIVFGGDILDMKCVSSFPDIEKTTIEEELVAGIEFMSKVREIVGEEVRLILIYGNHEFRIQRYIAMLHQKELAQFLNPNVLEHLRDGFTLYKGVEPIHYDGVKDLVIINSWYVNINHEFIVSHPDNFSKVVCKNSDQAIEYFIDRGEQFNLVVSAHNHHSGLHPDHFNKMGIESGCLCKPMKYADKKTNYKEQDIGYVLVAFDKDGHVDRNETRLYALPRLSLQRDNYIEV